VRLVESRKREGLREEGWGRRSEVASEIVTERSSQARESHESFSVAEVDAAVGRREMRRDDKAASKGSERGNWSGEGKIGTNRCLSVRNMLMRRSAEVAPMVDSSDGNSRGGVDFGFVGGELSVNE
jgi:hypothetical protein